MEIKSESEHALKKAPKLLRVLYVVILIIIAVHVTASLAKGFDLWYHDDDFKGFWQSFIFVFFFSFVILWPLHLLFLGLNVRYAIIDKTRRARFATIAAISATISAVMLYILIDWYARGAPMP